MSHKSTLLRTVEAFMAAFGGEVRLRDIKVLLLVQQGTHTGTGVSISEVARASGAPLESVRRQFTEYVAAGLLRKQPDSKDRRVIRYFTTELWADGWRLDDLITRLSQILGPPRATGKSGPPFPELLDLIDLFIQGYLGSIRVRGARMALLVYRATVEGRGVSISWLARVNGAPLETVRRVLSQHVDMGHIRFVQDPEDDRRTLVVTADVDSERMRIAEMSHRLEAIGRSWRGMQHLKPE